MNGIHLILLIVLLVIVLGAIPIAPWTSNWGLGWWPSGTALVFIILLLLLI